MAVTVAKWVAEAEKSIKPRFSAVGNSWAGFVGSQVIPHTAKLFEYAGR
jgi:hypothetical protein